MGLLALCVLLQAAVPVPDAGALAGYYNGSQAELAAELLLHPDGRFEYGLAYGALDEVAAGRWTVVDGAVALDSDPVRAPAYSFTDLGPEPAGLVAARLIVPQGMEPQYFSFVLVGDGMAPIERQVGQGGDTEIGYDPAHPPRGIHVTLPVYDLASKEFPIDLKAGGRRIEVRFTPNDLGRVAFDDTRLGIAGDGLHFERFGREIIFRKR